MEANIEFSIVIPNPNLTCGWLQSEVIRRYYEVLQKQAQDWQKSQVPEKRTESNSYNTESNYQNLKVIHSLRRTTREQRMSIINQQVKLKKKFIVALKTPD